MRLTGSVGSRAVLVVSLVLLLVTVYHVTFVFETRSFIKTINNMVLNKIYTPRRGLGGRYDVILGFCGELCDLTKPVEPGPFMGTVKAQVDCDAIFDSDEIDRPSEGPPVPWDQIPESLQAEYNHSGQVAMGNWFLDNSGDGGGRTEASIYTKEAVQAYIDAWTSGVPKDNYGGASEMINKAAETIGLQGKTILVIGTQQPWLEAVLLTKGPARVVTLEYGKFISQYPDHSFITPQEFRELYKEKKLPLFDVIFTYSSVEHSGLGRYGDALNPWGDILTIARAWCVSSPTAKLAIGVPTGGMDKIEFNAHRIYGPILYPYLTTNWRFIWSSSGNHKPGPTEADGVYQPVYIFEKNL